MHIKAKYATNMYQFILSNYFMFLWYFLKNLREKYEFEAFSFWSKSSFKADLN